MARSSVSKPRTTKASPRKGASSSLWKAYSNQFQEEVTIITSLVDQNNYVAVYKGLLLTHWGEHSNGVYEDMGGVENAIAQVVDILWEEYGETLADELH